MRHYLPHIQRYPFRNKLPRSLRPFKINWLLEQIRQKCMYIFLRYQLLHAIAETLIEAKEFCATKAIFLVHEFKSVQLNSKNITRNTTH
ncbi:MAG: DUF6946 family protein [Bacillota bacterium]